MKLRLSVFILLLAMWPATFRYTSVGIDTERVEGDVVRERFWRIRWPGDGAMMIGWVDELRPVGAKPVEAFDLGGTFLRPPKPVPATSIWNRLGFGWVRSLAGRDDAMLVGVPHWGLIVLSGLTLVWRRSGSSRRPAQTPA